MGRGRSLNRQPRHGTTGKALPGYEIRLVDDQDEPVKQGEIGDMHVKGPTRAIFYWNNRERSQQTFAGEWTKSGARDPRCGIGSGGRR